MPNWCANNVVIRHNDSAAMDRVEKALETGLFGEFLPTPAELLEGEGWYDWRVENWGTKWDVKNDGSLMADRFGQTLTLSFDTAWAPAIGFYEKLTELGYDVRASYWEPGMDFAGTYTSEDGDDYYEGSENFPEFLKEEFDIQDGEEA